MAILGNPILLSGGSRGGELNIFSGSTEPQTKHGIWIKSEQAITNIVQDNDIWTPNTFYDTGVQINTNTNFFVNNLSTNKVFYYNGYIYKFQNNAIGQGLYKAPVNTAVFTLVNASATIPTYGAAQDIKNPRYVYGVTGSTSQSSVGVVHKYDLETGTDTSLGGCHYYYQWSSSNQAGVIYNDSLYGFYCTSSGNSVSDKPSYVFKKALNGAAFSIENILDTSTYSHPKMEIVGSNLYIMHINSSSNLAVTKVNLETKSSTVMSLSGDLNLGISQSLYMFHTTDNANKIYIMCPQYGTNATKMFVLNVDTGVVSSYSLPSGIKGVMYGYGSMLYNNGVIYVYGVSKSTDTNYGIYQFKITGKSYTTGTLAIVRTSNNDGVYETELVSPKDRISGTYNMFTTGYNMVYQSIGGQLVSSHPVYNGNGSSWVQIR